MDNVDIVSLSERLLPPFFVPSLSAALAAGAYSLGFSRARWARRMVLATRGANMGFPTIGKHDVLFPGKCRDDVLDNGAEPGRYS